MAGVAAEVGEAVEAGEAIGLTDPAQRAVERDLHVFGCHFTATSTYPAGNDVLVGGLFRARSCCHAWQHGTRPYSPC